MNLPALLVSPVFIVLCQWTCLVALGWVAQGVLRRRHARWRVILWRGILCFGLLLPGVQFLELPGIRIPFPVEKTSTSEVATPVPLAAASDPIPPVKSTVQPVITSVSSGAVPGRINVPTVQTPAQPIPWGFIIIVIWGLGCVWGFARLIRLHGHLARLRGHAGPPPADLEQLAAQIRSRLNIRQPLEVRLSERVTSPFVCGLLKPTIMLPRTLAQQLPPGEIAALLSHEMAHLQKNDVRWCVAWRWVQAVFWFHPLVWPIPAAHNLACEQEADRVASGQWADQDSYARMLARLALRVLVLPAVETQLTLNGSSQIARRLSHLRQKGAGAWTWRHSVAGFALVGTLFLITAGCKLATADPGSASYSATMEFKKVLVVVQDEAGKPIAGATILPDGFRVKGRHGADAYSWNNKLFGPPEKSVTDPEGKAYVRYPVEGIPAEKEFTGKLIFSVAHPEFITVRPQEYSVDSPEQPIQLTRGTRLEVVGYFGPDHQIVSDLIPNLSQEGIKSNDWQKMGNGTFVYQKTSPGGHLLRLMGRPPTGEIVYSDTTAFTVEKGQTCHLQLEMKPGLRLEGRLDDNVPRPVKNGRVMIAIRPAQYPALSVIDDFYGPDEAYGGYTAREFWHSYRPINEDGTFAFESIPPGTVDLVALGDGFASKTMGKLQNRVNGVVTTNGPILAIPQAFPQVAPVTHIVVITEPTATLDFTATTKTGEPIEGIWVGMYPTVFRMWGPFGFPKDSSEEPYREIPHLPNLNFSGKTDKDGRLVMSNLPAEIRGLEVDSEKFQVPLQDVKGWRDRHVRTQFSPGMTNQLVMPMEPKGADFIGASP